MQRHDLVIRIAGESGEGVVSTGDLVTQAAARAGFRVLTFKTYPAEIKGGHVLYQLRLSGGELTSQGDRIDILLAFNQEAYDSSYGLLRDGGLLLYDSGSFTPPLDDRCRQQAVPLTEIAKTQLKFELGKNVVAVGVIAAMFGLDPRVIQGLLEERFGRKGEEILGKNLRALQAGINYVETHAADRDDFRLEAGAPLPGVMVVSGNQALSLGAMAAGLNCFFGYPITPASEIMEFLAAELPKTGGLVLQAEDEMASLGMVLGASYAGKKAMTSSAGPGISLMVEMLGLAAMAELPCVIVDVQRAGPSTGMPTKHEQGDLNLAVFGGHGEVQRIVLAPTHVADCFSQAVNAFNLAERYQVPVILLSDTTLATRTESITRPDLATLEVWDRLAYMADPAEPTGSDGYRRYQMTENGVSPMSVPGQEGGSYVSTGLEHNEYGQPRYDPTTHARMTEKRFRKLVACVADAPPADHYGPPMAEIGVITWGSTYGTVVEAARLATARGMAVSCLAPKMLWPLPDHQIEPFLAGKRLILVPEVNYSGQFADLLQARYTVRVRKVNTYGGVPFNVSQILDAIQEVYEGELQHA
ncbi:MAG: 2-oxoacid:acceptor oxidoreductase subunit alpha [Chloroflexota bacterium]